MSHLDCGQTKSRTGYCLLDEILLEGTASYLPFEVTVGLMDGGTFNFYFLPNNTTAEEVTTQGVSPEEGLFTTTAGGFAIVPKVVVLISCILLLAAL